MTLATLVLVVVAQAPASQGAISGRVVDMQGRPAAGIEVMLSGRGGRAASRPVLVRTKSDPDGRFQISLPVPKDSDRANFGQAVWAYDPKAGLAGQMFTPAKLPAAGSIVLKLPGPVHAAVRVVGPDGKPVPGARVMPEWVKVPGGTDTWSSFAPPDELMALLTASTDLEGNAQIHGCRAEDIELLSVEATRFGSQATAMVAKAGTVPTVKLKPAGRLIGRVQANDPKMARGLKVLAMTLPGERERPQLNGNASAITDSEGRFEIPAIAAGELALNVWPDEGVTLRGKPPRGVSIEAGKTTEVTIPTESPNRERTVPGQVVDSSGQPIAAATVFQSGDSSARTEAQTGADGRFQLAGVAVRPTYLFVRKPGYRFRGLAVAPQSEHVTVALAKTTEPPRVVLKTLPPFVPRDQELKLARRLLHPYAERVLKDGRDPDKVRTLQALAAVEPERCLDLIQKGAFKNPFLDGMIGQIVAMNMMEDDLDDALTVLESLNDPGSKVLGYIRASTKLGARKPAQAVEVLDRALLNARAAQGPDGIRVVMMGKVAEQFLDLGQTERGKAILREGEAKAKQFPNAGWVAFARGSFAEELAQIDLDAALELTKDLADPRAFNRHHGNIAHELAGRNPAQAERVLEIVKDKSQRNTYAVRVVYRMAPLDLVRAGAWRNRSAMSACGALPWE